MDNNNGNMGLGIVIALFGIAVATILVYFLGCTIEEHFWVKGIKQADWQAIYLKVVGINGILVFLASIGWVIKSHTTPAVTANGQSDPRPFWIVMLMVAIAVSLIVPFGLTFAGFIPHLHIVNILVSTLIFALVHYFVTVFSTPDKFKYAPLGAGVFRR